jgi:hypothetical protein
MSNNNSEIPKQIKTRSDAEKCVRIVFRQMTDGTQLFVVQLVSPIHCDKCGNEELKWRDLHNFPLKDGTRDTYREVRNKAIKARLNTIDMIVQNTCVVERIIKA